MKKYYFYVSAVTLVVFQVGLYVFVTQPAINEYYTASLMEKSAEASEVAEAPRDSEADGSDLVVTQLQEQLKSFQEEMNQLKSELEKKTEAPAVVPAVPPVQKPVAAPKPKPAPAPKPVEKIVERIVEVEKIVIQEVPVPQKAPAPVQAPAVEERKVQARQTGSVLVDDATCPSGKAWQDARMNRECD